IKQLLGVIALLVFTLVLILIIVLFNPQPSKWFVKSAEDIAKEKSNDSAITLIKAEQIAKNESNTFWIPKDITTVASDSNIKEQLLYGKKLIEHTAKYLGPKGTVLKITNGMNCQNCHLEAGTKAWGNNYGAVFSTYPKYRARSGKEEDIYKRINDCFERSLNGKALAEQSNEMQAIKSYIEFLGKDVKKGEKPKGSGIYDLPYLSRAIDVTNGKALFATKCQSCHQANGEGLLASDKIEYTYPPLWGKNSYNQGAGLYRMSRFAGYIKYNMPQGATFTKPQLTDEEAWDIAAFVNSQPRPSKDLSKDWPKINEKPVDHPFGPYADIFTEQQHKYGPYQPIKYEQKKQIELKEKSKTKL
ncbi:MAG: c-type cytochrome, partial [Ferruginibacter sp.]